MASKEHLARLEQGVDAWNKWREENPEIKPDLSETNLVRFDLRGANLSEACLTAADLRGADLRGARGLTKKQLWTTKNWVFAFYNGDLLSELGLPDNHNERVHKGKDLGGYNLRGACLFWADLQQANLRGAQLQEASLRGATLREADLQDADLTGAKNLLAGMLAGANVSGAKLPEDIRKFEGLTNVKEISESAQKVFLSMLLGCVYSWLTIATTIDARLLTNSTSSPLPIIQTEIPIAYFFWVAPLLLLCIYGYLHLYLQRLWEALADLPAVFPDGSSLDKRASFWLFTGLVYAHCKWLRNDRPPLSRLQVGLSILLAWWIVPATLLCFWLRYLHRHDWIGTSLHIVLLMVSIWGGIILQRLAAATLRGKKRKPFLWKKAWKDGRTYKRCAVALGTGLTGVIFYLLSLGPLDGDPSMGGYVFESTFPVLAEHWPATLKTSDAQMWMPDAFALLSYSPFADLEEVDVSTKPTDWTGKEEKEKDEIALVKGARLRNANLRHARASRAFLVKADLSGAQLQKAILYKANLQGANLSEAQLQEANLQQARLKGLFASSGGAGAG